MEYGDKTFKDEKLFLYQGFDPANINIANTLLWESPKTAVNQRDADLLFMWKRVNSSYPFSTFISFIYPLKRIAEMICSIRFYQKKWN